MSTTHSLQHNPVGQLAADHPGVVKAGRVGWLAKGIVYVIAGALALVLAGKASGWSTASTAPDQEASPTGALKTVAEASGGPLLLWLLAVGMLVYAAWRVVSACLPGGTDAKAWVKRIGYGVSAVIYTTFAFTAMSLARSRPTNADGNAKVTGLSDRVMQHTGGRVLIGAVGVIVIAAGLYRVGKGLKHDVDDELDLTGLPSTRRRVIERLGAVGEIGRGIGIGLVGFFLLRAALTYRQDEATGLDGALRRMATETWGLVLVVVVGIGFVAYGVFCVSTFTRRRLQAP